MRSKGKTSKKVAAEGQRDVLLQAAALQDHLTRVLRVPGGPTHMPSTQPGAQMTLAQHLGLIPRPPALLSKEEWSEVHLRSRIRQDSMQECPICREDFKTEQQVLLSCSHTFHQACLASFERYAGRRCCPLCRAQQYQKRMIHDGAEAFRHKCATIIQARVRGHAARKRCKELRKHRPPQDPKLKAKWAAERLQEESDRVLQQMQQDTEDLDALFAELDASLSLSRSMSDAIARPLLQRMASQQQPTAYTAVAPCSHQEGGSSQCQSAGIHGDKSDANMSVAGPISRVADARPGDVTRTYSSLSSSSGRTHSPGQLSRSGSSRRVRFHSDEPDTAQHTKDRQESSAVNTGHNGESIVSTVPDRTSLHATSTAEPDAHKCQSSVPSQDGVDWEAVLWTGRSRGDVECAICMGSLARRGEADVAWLSCTHCFHLECVTAFEAFELGSGGTPTCPVCRRQYHRRCFGSG